MSFASLFLFKDRRFFPLFMVQFFGAFNDNAYKLAMLTLISYKLSHSVTQSEFYQVLAGILFIIPFFICSALAGQLADKYDKALVTRYVKAFELLLIMLGSLGFYLSNIILMMVVLTGMGIHSAFFGTIKYSILPEHYRKEELMAATALIEGSTFIAILLGTILGTLSIGVNTSAPYVAIIMTICAALIGFVASLFIPMTPAIISFDFKLDLWPWRSALIVFKQAKKTPGMLIVMLTISWFWLLGAVLLTKLPDYCHYILGADTTVFALFLALFSFGIALGSLVINKVLNGRLMLQATPIALLMFTILIVDIYCQSLLIVKTPLLIGLDDFLNSFNYWRVALDFFMLGFYGGVLIVPLYTFMQENSPSTIRARIIAANNIYNSWFMIIGSVFVLVLLYMHCTILEVFLCTGLLNAFVAVSLLFYLRQHKHILFKS